MKDKGGSDDSGRDSSYASTHNSAERQASADYMSEALNTGHDPIPTQVPDWASGNPTPGGESQK